MSVVRELVLLYGRNLSEAVKEFLERNRGVFPGGEAVAGRWARELERVSEGAREAMGPVEVMALAFRALNILTSLGIVAGVTLDSVRLESLPSGFDRSSVERVLQAVRNCMYLQFLVHIKEGA